MKKIALAATALSTLAWLGPAFSADLPVKAPRSVPVPIISWTGCHVGGHVGGGWGKKDWSQFTDRFASLGSPTSVSQVSNLFTIIAGNTTLLDSSTTPLAPGAIVANPINSFSEDTAGFLGGGQVGCDLQFAPRWVVGIEGAGSWTGLTANENVSFSSPPASGSATAHARVDGLFSVTGRIGYTPIDTMLVYVRGGAAWVRDTYSVTGNVCSALINSSNEFVGDTPIFFTNTSSCAASSSFNFGANQNRIGWTAGVGFEMIAWKNTSWFVEYDAYDFGTKHVIFFDSSGASSGGSDIRQWINVVKVGLNFHFGPHGGVN
jgi:outer membrane immunogenic protein